ERQCNRTSDCQSQRLALEPTLARSAPRLATHETCTPEGSVRYGARLVSPPTMAWQTAPNCFRRPVVVGNGLRCPSLQCDCDPNLELTEMQARIYIAVSGMADILRRPFECNAVR